MLELVGIGAERTEPAKANLKSVTAADKHMVKSEVFGMNELERSRPREFWGLTRKDPVELLEANKFASQSCLPKVFFSVVCDKRYDGGLHSVQRR